MEKPPFESNVVFLVLTWYNAANKNSGILAALIGFSIQWQGHIAMLAKTGIQEGDMDIWQNS